MDQNRTGFCRSRGVSWQMENGRIYIRDAENLLRVIEPGFSPVRVCLSTDGSLIAARNEELLTIWAVRTGLPVCQMELKKWWREHWEKNFALLEPRLHKLYPETRLAVCPEPACLLGFAGARQLICSVGGYIIRLSVDQRLRRIYHFDDLPNGEQIRDFSIVKQKTICFISDTGNIYPQELGWGWEQGFCPEADMEAAPQTSCVRNVGPLTPAGSKATPSE